MSRNLLKNSTLSSDSMEIDHLYISHKFRMRDPVHGYIVFDRNEYRFLLDIMDSFEFQRLRRIKQLGATCFVYPGAEHSRFSHSIGTMWIMYQFGREFEEDIELEKDLMHTMCLAALIHDIGHGPFSHVFERITNYDHEEMTHRFIKERLPEIVQNFSSNDIIRLFQKDIEPEYTWVGDLLASQIDVDRMDFLLRDSLFTGVDYGRFDMQRVFHSLAIGEIEDENHIVILSKGLHALEGFFIAYHHMYWQVYLHRVTRGFELLLEKIFCRMKDLLQKEKMDIDIQPQFGKLLNEEPLALDEFFQLDDCTIMEAIKKCHRSRDEILSNLCNRFLERKVFKCIKIKEINSLMEFMERGRKFFENRDIPYDYYFAWDNPKKISIERPVLGGDLFLVEKDKTGKVSGPDDFADKSDIIRSLLNVEHTESRVYCSEDIVDDLRAALNPS
jgi:HD superfamily phosphohydrolase